MIALWCHYLVEDDFNDDHNNILYVIISELPLHKATPSLTILLFSTGCQQNCYTYQKPVQT